MQNLLNQLNQSPPHPIKKEPHPLLTALEQIVSHPQNQWLPHLSSLKWTGDENIDLTNFQSVIHTLQQPIQPSTDPILIKAILSLFCTLINHCNRIRIQKFDILSVKTTQHTPNTCMHSFINSSNHFKT